MDDSDLFAAGPFVGRIRSSRPANRTAAFFDGLFGWNGSPARSSCVDSLVAQPDERKNARNKWCPISCTSVAPAIGGQATFSLLFPSLDEDEERRIEDEDGLNRR